MSNDPLPLAIFDQSNEKKIITKVAANWDDVDVRCIFEILQSFEVIIQTDISYVDLVSCYNSSNVWCV